MKSANTIKVSTRVSALLAEANALTQAAKAKRDINIPDDVAKPDCCLRLYRRASRGTQDCRRR